MKPKERKSTEYKKLSRFFDKAIRFEIDLDKKLTKKHPLGSLDLRAFSIQKNRMDFLINALTKAGAEQVKCEIAFDKNGIPNGFLVSWKYSSTENKAKGSPSDKFICNPPVIKTGIHECGNISLK